MNYNNLLARSVRTYFTSFEMVEILSWNNFLRCFHTLCIAVATSLIVYWVYLYGLNEDLCTIDYKSYHHDKQDVYPTLSLCFVNTFSSDKLKMNFPNFNRTSYWNFLKGQQLDSSYLDIDYSAVALNLSKFLAGEAIIYRNGSYKHNYFSNGARNIFFPSYSGIEKIDKFYNCFALQVPQEQEVEGYGALIKSNVFQDNIRFPLYGMIAYIHYPNQLMVAAKTVKLSWPKRERYDMFEMKFKVNGVEILQRRNKNNQPCVENWQNYDDAVLVKHLSKIGCRSPYQMPSVDYPICDTKEKIRKSQFNLTTGEIDIYPPCKAMEKVYYTFKETDLEATEWGIKGHFWASIYLYDHQFKNISKTR